MPSSTNVPVSIRSASRSRAVSLSCSCWRSIFSAPPPSLEQVHDEVRQSLIQEGVSRVLAQAKTGLPIEKFNVDGSPATPETGAMPLPAPASGGTAFAPQPPGAVLVGGRHVRDGDVVLTDDDGVLIAPEAQLLAAVDQAQAIEAAEAALLAGMAEGRSLASLTNLAEHVEALRAGRPSALEFRV